MWLAVVLLWDRPMYGLGSYRAGPRKWTQSNGPDQAKKSMGRFESFQGYIQASEFQLLVLKFA